MLKVTENERLTRVGPATPMGESMRRSGTPLPPWQSWTRTPCGP